MSLAAYTMLQKEMVWIGGFEFLRKDFQDRRHLDRDELNNLLNS